MNSTRWTIADSRPIIYYFSFSPEPVYNNSLQGKSVTGVAAPKPFKKRYLAEQHSAPPPVYDGNFLVTSASPASPAGEEAACAALLELANTGHGRGSSSSGQSATSDPGEAQRASPSETPPFQTLREAVWSRVAGTLLKQVGGHLLSLLILYFSI